MVTREKTATRAMLDPKRRKTALQRFRVTGQRFAIVALFASFVYSLWIRTRVLRFSMVTQYGGGHAPQNAAGPLVAQAPVAWASPQPGHGRLAYPHSAPGGGQPKDPGIRTRGEQRAGTSQKTSHGTIEAPDAPQHQPDDTPSLSEEETTEQLPAQPANFVCRLESDQTTPQPVKQPVGVQPAVVGAVASAVRPRFLSGRRLAIPALLVCLASSFWLWGSYLTTRQSVAKLVGAEPAIVGAMASALRPRYLFSIYGVEEPFGLAVTPRGDRLYVAESGGERLVRVFDANGKQLQAFAPPDTLPQTRVPVYVALHRSGQVYVTDRFRRSLDVYDAGGNHKGSLAPPFAEGWQPLGVRVDVDSLVITEVTDGKHRVLKTDLQGKPILQYGQEGGTEDPGGLRFPNSAVVDSLGRIYVSDGNNARVQVLDRDGNLLYTIPGFGLPRGLEFDSYQRLHVVDTVNGEVRVFDASGVRPNLLFSFGGTGDDQLNYPNDIAIDDNDRVYIADRASNRVQVWVY